LDGEGRGACGGRVWCQAGGDVTWRTGEMAWWREDLGGWLAWRGLRVEACTWASEGDGRAKTGPGPHWLGACEG